MSRPQFQSNPKVQQIFDDLEKYLEFCVEYGYKYDEANLYDMRSYPYQQYNKYISHKNFKNQWVDDAKRNNSNVVID